MTIMGMAASQARFLGLTARKSNVEYQGQQVNQQRTALSNESANLYNQMMELNVPTPPSTTDFYKTSYVLDDSSKSYDSSDYEITNLSKTYNNQNEYLVTLTTKKEYSVKEEPAYTIGTLSTKEDSSGVNYTSIPLFENDSKVATLQYSAENLNAYTGENNSLSVNAFQIYKVEPNKNLDGKNACCDGDGLNYYFYQDSKGKNHFLKQEDLDTMLNPDRGAGVAVGVVYARTYTKPESTQVIATLETSDTGRYSSIQIQENEEYPKNLSNKTFSLSVVQEQDENAYNDAFNDYEYEKAQYDKAISDINAKTEIIQHQDQQLELRLKQLDTEENAIKTEMDSVQSVLKNNVEKTFNTFNA